MLSFVSGLRIHPTSRSLRSLLERNANEETRSTLRFVARLIRHFEPHPKFPEVRELYYFKEDIGETDDLARGMPEKVKEVDAFIDQFVKDTGALVPKPNPNFNPVVKVPLRLP